MSSLSDAIKKEVTKSKKSVPAGSEETVYSGTEGLVIESTLNKLFYVQPDCQKELELLSFQKAQDQQSGDRYGLHCSAIIGPGDDFCYREQVLSLFYKQIQGDNIPVGLRRIFKEGTFIGEKWQRMFVSGGVGVKEDMDISRFNKRWDLSYTPDGIITINGTKWLVEIKSQNTFLFKKAKSHPSGRKQLRMYMFLERIKHGFVLVEDKNTQEFKIFIEVFGKTFTKEDVMPYVERLEAIQEYKEDFIENKAMVSRHHKCTSSSCPKAQKCNMRDACWNVGMGRVKLDV